jgi:hypothetical protein
VILCLEGPSAVGKTSTAHALAERLGAAVVPEVNVLFVRPAPEPEGWYLGRQAERWAMARQALATHPLAVLDGDPFQPLWYNWSFGFQGCQPLDALAAFYRPLIADEALGFPDAYVHLVIGEDELRRRKEADATRSRRNFDGHLRLVDTQRLYFSAMVVLAPSLVQAVEAVTVAGNVRRIEMILDGTRRVRPDPLALFDGLVAWLESHQMERS